MSMIKFLYSNQAWSCFFGLPDLQQVWDRDEDYNLHQEQPVSGSSAVQ